MRNAARATDGFALMETIGEGLKVYAGEEGGTEQRAEAAARVGGRRALGPDHGGAPFRAAGLK